MAPEVFRKASDTRTPQGILFVGRQLSYSLEELIKAARERQRAGGRPPLFLLLEDIQDPGNLGTIFRTAEAVGADGILMSSHTVDVYNPKTIRSTMGSIYRVPFIYREDICETIRILQKHDICVYAADLGGRKAYDTYDYRGGTAFLIGNEGNGLREETAACAEERIWIPMEGKVESLNAAVASTVLFYEAYRQRRKGIRNKPDGKDLKR